MFAQTPLRKIRPGTGFHTAASNVGERTAKYGTLCGIMSRRGKLNREKTRVLSDHLPTLRRTPRARRIQTGGLGTLGMS
jgi:hypothetical protein